MESDAKEKKMLLVFVQQLKDLRCQADAAEARLLRKAYEIEKKHEKLWSQFYESFDELLEKNHICDSRRYRNFVMAEGELGAEVADKIGVPATLEAFRISDSKQRKLYIEAGTKRLEEEGVPWSGQAAATARKTITGADPDTLKLNDKIDREHQLHEENVKLRREIQELKRELKAKDIEIARLLKKTGRATETRAS